MHSRSLLILLVCLWLFVEENQGLRIRLPGLKLSATFRRTASYLKKKFRLDTSKEDVSDPSLTSDGDLLDENDEL